MTHLNIGDVVRLKSGGPLMTVREFSAASPLSPPDAARDHVKCHYFDAGHNGKIVSFPVATLDRQPGTQPPAD